MALESSIAAAALWLMDGELMVLLLMVSVQMALGSSIATAALWLMVGRLMVFLLMVSVQRYGW